MLAWQNFTASYAARIKVPATAQLVALHDLVTEHVPLEYAADKKRRFHCPAQVLQELKMGIFAGDSDVQKFTLPSYVLLSGVPGLSSHDDLVSCSN